MMRQPIYQTRGYENHGEGSAFLAGIIITLLVIAVVLGILLLLRKSRENAADRPDLSEIIQGRYARGEINKEEYDRLRNDLLVTEAPANKKNS